MATTTPDWTDSVDVVAAQVLTRGSTVRGTIDLRGKHGARLLVKMGRGGTATITNGCDVLIQEVINNDTARAGGAHPNGIALKTQLPGTAAASTTVSADSNSAQAVLTVASGTGFAAGDYICIQDSGGGVTRLEFHKISKISGGTITLTRNLQYTHTAAQADTVRNQADVFPRLWLDGGSLWEVIFDYGDDAAGDSVTVIATAQTLDSYSTV